MPDGITIAISKINKETPIMTQPIQPTQKQDVNQKNQNFSSTSKKNENYDSEDEALRTSARQPIEDENEEEDEDEDLDSDENYEDSKI
jgi:hypothetical protein